MTCIQDYRRRSRPALRQTYQAWPVLNRLSSRVRLGLAKYFRVLYRGRLLYSGGGRRGQGKFL